jgi:hypothetical protein
MNLSEQSIVSVTKDQVSCSLGAEAAILNMRDGTYYGLDPVGAQIWQLLQTPRRIAEIQELLLQEYDVEAERCQSDLLQLLEDLLGAGLNRSAVTQRKAASLALCESQEFHASRRPRFRQLCV